MRFDNNNTLPLFKKNYVKKHKRNGNINVRLPTLHEKDERNHSLLMRFSTLHDKRTRGMMLGVHFFGIILGRKCPETTDYLSKMCKFLLFGKINS